MKTLKLLALPLVGIAVVIAFDLHRKSMEAERQGIESRRLEIRHEQVERAAMPGRDFMAWVNAVQR